MIRDILVGAKADDLFETSIRDGTTRTWTRETENDKWRIVSDESQSLYELGMTEKGQILCEFQVRKIHTRPCPYKRTSEKQDSDQFWSMTGRAKIFCYF